MYFLLAYHVVVLLTLFHCITLGTTQNPGILTAEMLPLWPVIVVFPPAVILLLFVALLVVFWAVASMNTKLPIVPPTIVSAATIPIKYIDFNPIIDNRLNI
jgi:hypothetical protein